MEEGLCSFCTRNPNSRIFAVIRVPNTYRFVCRYRQFSPEVHRTRKVVKFSIFCYVLNVEVRFLPLTIVDCIHAGHSTETAGGRPTYRYIWRSAIETKFSPSKYHLLFHPRTPTNPKGSDGGNPMGSAVKKNGRGGICERKLFRAVLNWD